MYRTRIRRRVRRLAIVASSALALSVLSIAPATAAATCGPLASGDATVTFDSGGGAVTFVKSGENLAVSGACSATYAFGAVDTIFVLGDAGADSVTFDRSGGDLTDSNAIDFEVDLGEGSDSLMINGTASKDALSLGTKGINVNYSGSADIYGPEPNISEVDDARVTSMNIETYTVNGLGGTDSLWAGGQLSGEPFTESVTINGGDGSDSLMGGDGDDKLYGDAGNDKLDGGLGDDYENGGKGADIFDQEDEANGADTLVGGDAVASLSNDTVDYRERTLGVTVTTTKSADNFSDTPAEWVLGDDGQPDVSVPVEGAATPQCSDSLDNDDADTDVDLEDDGCFNADDDDEDFVSEGDNVWDVEILRGGDGNDSLTGSAANDALYGGPGNDVLDGEAGNDKLYGALGDDTEIGGAGNDKFFQDGSNNGADTLYGEDGNDTVFYNGRANAVTATVTTSDGEWDPIDPPTLAECDEVDAGGDTNMVDDPRPATDADGDCLADDNDGETGENDNLVDIKKVVGGRGGDALTGSSTAAAILVGQGGKDTLTGGSANDILKGGGGNDTLNGLAGNDRLVGGGGDDKIDGGDGRDSANGGPGKDTCIKVEKMVSC